jgi:hypothetical protein
MPSIARPFAIFLLLSALSWSVQAQPLTGVWHGKVKKNGFAGASEQVELKLVRQGDSLVGVAYYYQSPSRYDKVPVKGHVDPWTGTVTFWDDPERSKDRHAGMAFETDFNCPGEGVLLLDGHGGLHGDPGGDDLTVHLQKVDEPIFADGWDEVIRDPGSWAGGPGLIERNEEKANGPVVQTPVPAPKPAAKKMDGTPTPVAPVAKVEPVPTKPTPQQMMESRSKRLVAEIPVAGDSVELSFYDNAEIDGDSISLFMNGRLLYEHVLLKATAFRVKIPVSAMEGSNDLVMVAENLGSIPPNTSLMVAYVEGKRYEATLESTEGSSAMIRFYKPVKTD